MYRLPRKPRVTIWQVLAVFADERAHTSKEISTALGMQQTDACNRLTRLHTWGYLTCPKAHTYAITKYGMKKLKEKRKQECALCGGTKATHSYRLHIDNTLYPRQHLCAVCWEGVTGALDMLIRYQGT